MQLHALLAAYLYMNAVSRFSGAQATVHEAKSSFYRYKTTINNPILAIWPVIYELTEIESEIKIIMF
jgi:hypothetical protein